MVPTDLVSIVTPAYKASAFVGDAIRSVLAQSYPNFEMLVVDDGSPDDTAAKVAEFARQDDRIRLISQANAGPAMARQRALDHARGRYIAFLDSDDFWLPAKLERQLAFMAATDAPLTYTQFRRVDALGKRPGQLIEVPERLTYRELLGNTAIATSTAIVDLHKTGPLKMTKTYYDDFVLWLGILKGGTTARGLREDLMRYRVVEQSVSRNKFRSVVKVWRTYRDIEKLPAPYAAWCLTRYGANAVAKYRTR